MITRTAPALTAGNVELLIVRRYSSVLNTVVHALLAFENCRRLPARLAKFGSGFPLTNGQNSSGRSNPPRKSRRLGHPPRQTSTNRQSRQNCGIESSSRKAGELITADPDRSNSAKPKVRFRQYTHGNTSPFGVTRIVLRPHTASGHDWSRR